MSNLKILLLAVGFCGYSGVSAQSTFTVTGILQDSLRVGIPFACELVRSQMFEDI